MASPTAVPVPGGDSPVAMSREDIARMVAEASKNGANEALKVALGEGGSLKGFSREIIEGVTALNAERKGVAPFNESELGPHPLGRKLRALGLTASIEKSDATDPDAIAAAVKKHWRASIAEPTLKWVDHVKATLLAGVANAAGDMIQPDHDPRWIELLTAKARIRGISVTTPMPRGATTRRRQTQDATSYYQGENDRMTPSNIAVDRVAMSYKKLTTLCVVGNDLLRFGGSEVDLRVQNSMIRSQGLREDRAFLVGNPPTDAGSPQGIRYQTAGSMVVASTGVTLATVQADLTAARSRIESAEMDVEDGELAWVMSPATKWVLYALATTTGDWVFANEINQGRLMGLRLITTTQLSVSKSWIGANSGLVMLVHAPSLEILDSLQREIAAYRGGAYHDPSAGVVLSGISQDETVFTCISEHDFFQNYAVAATIMTGYAT